MRFNGELKFPELDHPGVPVVFSIDEQQAEIFVGGESLGRWSLYDIHARRLVASAFQIDLEGTEVTFVADDPIDFAYRGVDHMAQTWADIKSKRVASRSIAIRKSRRGVTESRLEDLRAAMEQNLESLGPRRIAGEPDQPTSSPIDRILTTPVTTQSAAEILSETEPESVSTEDTLETAEAVEEAETGQPVSSPQHEDWDRRDPEGAIPVIGVDTQTPPETETQTAYPDSTPDGRREPDEPTEPAAPLPTAEELEIEAARRQLAEERSRLDEERQAAELREANLIEAYRLEVQRLEAEREQLRIEAEARAAARIPDEPEESAPRVETKQDEGSNAPELVDLSDPDAPEPEPEPEPEREREPDTHVEPEPELEPEPEAPVTMMPAPAEHEIVREPEPALAGAAKERRAGLMGAVKAAFGTGVKDHTHNFIEAPGGLGITRYVCEECGYVSISSGN